MGLFTGLVKKGAGNLAKTIEEGSKVERDFYKKIISEATESEKLAEKVAKKSENCTSR